MDYYIDFLASEDDSKQLIAQLIQAVHGANKGDHRNLMISFPDWMDAKNDALGKPINSTTMGSRLRVFGSEKNLCAFLFSQIPVKLCRSGSVQTVGVKKTPDTTKFERFIRDRTNERLTDGFKSRAAIRFGNRELKGKHNKPVSDNKIHLDTRKVVKIEFSSESNSCLFLMYIARVGCDDSSNESSIKTGSLQFSSTYGLSTSFDFKTPVF